MRKLFGREWVLSFMIRSISLSFKCTVISGALENILCLLNKKLAKFIILLVRVLHLLNFDNVNNDRNLSMLRPITVALFVSKGVSFIRMRNTQ